MSKKLISILVALMLLGTLVWGVVIAKADTPGNLDHVVITPSSTTLSAGGTQQFSAQAYDATNVPIPGLAYSWAVVAGGGNITDSGLFTAGSVAGTFTNTVEAVTVQNGIIKMAFASVAVNAAAGVLDHVVITPSSAILLGGGTQQFSAQGYDAGNTAITGLTYTWSVVAGGGTISTSGLFTAGSSPGIYANTVQASATQVTIVKTAVASVTVNSAAGPLDHVVISPSSVTLSPAGTQQFSAQGYDAGNIAISGLTFNWTVVAGGGTIDGSGLFTAGTAAGTFTGTVQVLTAQNNIVKTAFATVTVGAVAPPATINQLTQKLVSLVTGTLRSVSFDNFLSSQWMIKDSGNTLTVKAFPGVVESISGSSLTVLPNGQGQTVNFTLTADTVIMPANTNLQANDRVVVVTVNDQPRLVLKVSSTGNDDDDRLPPGLRKGDKSERFDDRQTPPGWSHGKKMGWNKGDIEEGDDD